MGFNRNGARSFLDIIAKACKLSHLPGFWGGVRRILGNENADALQAVWGPFCAVVDVIIAADDWYNRKDHNAEADASGDEDGTAG